MLDDVKDVMENEDLDFTSELDDWDFGEIDEDTIESEYLTFEKVVKSVAEAEAFVKGKKDDYPEHISDADDVVYIPANDGSIRVSINLYKVIREDDGAKD